jgi:hypothetical protein
MPASTFLASGKRACWGLQHLESSILEWGKEALANAHNLNRGADLRDIKVLEDMEYQVKNGPHMPYHLVQKDWVLAPFVWLPFSARMKDIDAMRHPKDSRGSLMLSSEVKKTIFGLEQLEKLLRSGILILPRR